MYTALDLMIDRLSQEESKIPWKSQCKTHHGIYKRKETCINTIQFLVLYIYGK